MTCSRALPQMPGSWLSARSGCSCPIRPCRSPTARSKLADRLAAFILGAGTGLLEAGAPVALRRVALQPGIVGRDESVAEVARSLQADTHLPLVVCGPDAPAIVATAAGRPLVLLDVRDLERPRGARRRDARGRARARAAVLRRSRGPERQRAVAAARADRQPARAVGADRAHAPRSAGAGDRTVAARRATVPVVRRAAVGVGGASAAPTARPTWRPSSGCRSSRSSRRRRSAASPPEPAGWTAPEPADLDLGARHASSSRLGDLAARLESRLQLR